MTKAGKKAQAREAKKAAILASKRRRRNLVAGGSVALVLAVVAFLVTRPEPAALAGTETFADLGGGHLAQGDPVPEYNSSPATSGPHNANSASCGIYRDELPDVTLVHNLEHGTVVIQYIPDLPESDRDDLEAFARSKSTHILLAPRDDLTSPVVLSAWTRLLRLDGVDVETLETFYNRWSRVGPEVGVACPFSIDQTSS